ncbi:MAG: CPBP family intramembrane metalloprotease [Actinomycetota bacterium]|nr:CPBP family intramembrane metalloprotease [Actinomycetota bacterium]
MTGSGSSAPGPLHELVRFVRAALLDPVPRDHRESDSAFRRRRIVACITIVIGAVLLGLSLNLSPGDKRFYLSTFALAAVWTIGSFVSGPLHLGQANTRAGGRFVRPVLQPVVLGIAAVAIFVAGAVVVAHIPPLRDSVNAVLDHVRFASLPVVAVITLVNGIAEELFFRGALFAAIGARYPVPISTVIYGLTTVATGNVMLVFAAVVLGLLVGLQRRVTGGVLAPMIIHCVWSIGMLLALPPLLEHLA